MPSLKLTNLKAHAQGTGGACPFRHCKRNGVKRSGLVGDVGQPMQSHLLCVLVVTVGFQTNLQSDPHESKHILV